MDKERIRELLSEYVTRYNCQKLEARFLEKINGEERIILNLIDNVVAEMDAKNSTSYIGEITKSDEFFLYREVSKRILRREV